MLSSSSCQAGWAALMACLPNNGQSKPSRDSPSLGLALVSTHANQILMSSHIASSCVHSAMLCTSSSREAPLIKVEQADSLSMNHRMSVPCKMLAWFSRRGCGITVSVSVHMVVVVCGSTVAAKAGGAVRLHPELPQGEVMNCRNQGDHPSMT